MVTHTLNLCSAFNPSKVRTHSSEQTHTVNTHPEQWAAIYVAAPGEHLGVRCLAQGHLSRGIEGGESAGHSLPLPTIPAGPRLELATFGLRVRLLLLGHDFPTINVHFACSEEVSCPVLQKCKQDCVSKLLSAKK